MQTKKEKLAIIDANALIHRAFHALPPLMTKDGVLVNAVYGFANILLKVLKDIKPDYVAVCFDVARETFRHKMYQDYKAHRKHGPQELYDQFEMVKELVKAFKMPLYALAGYEADDLIGTIVNKIQDTVNNKQGKVKIENYIVTGDMDTLQLIAEDTKVYTLHKGISDTIIYDESAVREKYGFGQELLVDYKALRGDPSDNIPGVKGVGEKTAQELIKKFKALENLYDFIDGLKKLGAEARNQALEMKGIKKSVYTKLINHKKEAFLSKRLATIKCDVKMDFNLAETRVQPFDAARLVELFQTWNFKSLIGRIPAAEKIIIKGQSSLFNQGNQPGGGKNKFEIRQGYELLDHQDKRDYFLEKLAPQKEFAIDTETDSVDPWRLNLLGVSFSWQAGSAYYLPIEKLEISGQPSGIFYNQLNKILADEKIKKIGHNIKFDLEALARAGFELKGIAFDTMVASYLLNPGSRQHSLAAAAFTEFGYEMTAIESLLGPKGKDQLNMSQVAVARVADYSCEDADYTWRLYEKLKKQLLKNDLLDLLEDIENPLIRVLAKMEKNGVMIDVNFLKKMSRELALKINSLEAKIFKMAGMKFNVRSPLQLKEILFDKLNISTAGLARTKTGISTAAVELDKLQGRHPLIDLIREHRELAKLKSTYTDALPQLINPADKRIHTSFNQTVTATGRLSSSDPNLQNIPIRTELGRKIRQAFVAPVGYKIAALDYSQIELRIAAALSGDKKMIAAFERKEDFHARTAAEVFEVSLDKVTSEMRRKAKEVNFGILYGLGAHGLAQRTGVSYGEALAFIEKYFDVYSDLKEYLEETITLAHSQEYVETLFGRKRYLPEINADHQGLRAQAERMALNHPFQGSSADLIKMAMIEVDKLIEKEFSADAVRMILQVHDELVFEIKDGLVKKASELIKDEMETVYKLKVPIVVDVGIGKNWGECK